MAASTAATRRGMASGVKTPRPVSTSDSSTGSNPPAIAPTASASASATCPRDSPGFRSTKGSAACTVSTYHASSGPDPSARPAPSSTTATTRAHNSSATANVTAASTLSAADISNARRRPSTSAMPPVGSSRSTTTAPWRANSAPTVASEYPRDVTSSTSTGISTPGGSQRRADNSMKRRCADRGVITARPPQPGRQS